jgi:radical SAM protein with 4Fe4S-binding SPASM domain
MRISEKRFQRIFIEIGNICNLQCTFCPVVDRPKHQMMPLQLNDILGSIKEYTEQVCFHVMGEPLAHPHFNEFITIASSIKVPVEITTNGTLLNASAEEGLLNPIVRQVNFSIQSFMDNFPGISTKTYLQKIFAFTKRALVQRPDQYINFRLWNLDGNATEDAINHEIIQSIEAEFATTINTRVNTRLIKSKKILQRLYLHYDSRFVWPKLDTGVARSKGTCYGTRSHIAILAEGTVVPCCLDKEANIPLGNVFTQDFTSIVQNPRLRAMKEGFEKNELVEKLCQTCQYASRFDIGR